MDLSQLQQLHSQVLDNLVGMSDILLDSDSTDYEALIVLSRSTGNPKFLQKAYEKIDKQSPSQEKADALLDLLNEINVVLAQETDQQTTDSPPEDPVLAPNSTAETTADSDQPAASMSGIST